MMIYGILFWIELIGIALLGIRNVNSELEREWVDGLFLGYTSIPLYLCCYINELMFCSICLLFSHVCLYWRIGDCLWG